MDRRAMYRALSNDQLVEMARKLKPYLDLGIDSIEDKLTAIETVLNERAAAGLHHNIFDASKIATPEVEIEEE